MMAGASWISTSFVSASTIRRRKVDAARSVAGREWDRPRADSRLAILGLAPSSRSLPCTTVHRVGLAKTRRRLHLIIEVQQASPRVRPT
jgi:hypothetical protein